MSLCLCSVESSDISWKRKKSGGIKIICQSETRDFSAMAFITDHVNSLIEQWFPGQCTAHCTCRALTHWYHTSDSFSIEGFVVRFVCLFVRWSKKMIFFCKKVVGLKNRCFTWRTRRFEPASPHPFDSCQSKSEKLLSQINMLTHQHNPTRQSHIRQTRISGSLIQWDRHTETAVVDRKTLWNKYTQMSLQTPPHTFSYLYAPNNFICIP